MRIGSWTAMVVLGFGVAAGAEVSVQATGGVATYRGDVGPEIGSGSAVGAMVGLEANQYLGLELGYQGSNVGVDGDFNGFTGTRPTGDLNQHGVAADLKVTF